MGKAYEPTLVAIAEPQRPAGSWLRRSWTAMFGEHRLPTRVAAALDRGLVRLGWGTKSLRIAGFDLRVRRLEADEHYVREVMIERAYSLPGYEISETDTVVDVGGNIGALALDAGRRARRGRVVSVEPVEANFRLLCENVSRNNLANVTPMRAAVVGTSATETTVYLSPLGSGHHTIVRPLAGNASRGETVEAVRLQDLFERYAIERCDFLKLDCEGAEFEILENLPAEIARRISRLAMEYHTQGDRPKREQGSRLIDVLLGLGFRIDQYTDVQGTPRGMIFAQREKKGDILRS